MPRRAILFIAVMVTGGSIVLATALGHWHSNDLLRVACYLVIAMVASTMKVKLPGMDSTMSVHFLFVLLGVLELSLAETLVVGCAAALAQSLWRQRPDPVKVAFNVLGMTSLAIGATYTAYHLLGDVLKNSMPLLLVAAACTYFISTT